MEFPVDVEDNPIQNVDLSTQPEHNVEEKPVSEVIEQTSLNEDSSTIGIESSTHSKIRVVVPIRNPDLASNSNPPTQLVDETAMKPKNSADDEVDADKNDKELAVYPSQLCYNSLLTSTKVRWGATMDLQRS